MFVGDLKFGKRDSYLTREEKVVAKEGMKKLEN